MGERLVSGGGPGRSPLVARARAWPRCPRVWPGSGTPLSLLWTPTHVLEK
jgi:hypothetical protein